MAKPVEVLRHIKGAVVRHGFTSPSDWATALQELSELSDDQIVELAQEELNTGSTH